MPISTPPVWLVCPVPTTARASPKSATLTTPSMPMSTFSGLMSRCTMPARWAAVSPASTGSSTANASADGQPAAGVQQVAQRAAADQLHDQEDQALVGALVADRDDVGVAEHRRGAGLAGEPVDERGVVDQVVGHDLDRDRAVQPQVGGRVDRRHAAAREPLLEAVAPLEDQADHGVGHGGVHAAECRSAAGRSGRTTRLGGGRGTVVRGGHGPLSRRSARPGHRVPRDRCARRTGRTAPSCAPAAADSPASTRDTPAAPPVASPQITGRPTKTAVAPRARAVRTSEPRPDPAVGVDLDVGRRPPPPPRAGRAALATTGSACRPPCVDTHTAAAPACDAARRRRRRAARPSPPPAARRARRTGRCRRTSRPASRPARRAAGGWLASGRSAGRTKSWPQVAQPPAEHRQVDGEHQRPVAGLPGPAGEVVGVRGGVQPVELEPLRARPARRRRRRPAAVLAEVDTVISAPAAAAPARGRPLAVRVRPAPGRPTGRRRSACATVAARAAWCPAAGDAGSTRGRSRQDRQAGGRLARVISASAPPA